MRWLALIVVLLGACGDSEPPGPPESVRTHQLPDMALLPSTGSQPAKPTSWVPDGRPTLMLFTASWCPTCPASILTDVALAQAYRDRFQVGVALLENTDEDFVQSPMAYLFGDLPVWSANSVKEWAVKCGASEIPMACIVDRGRVVFRGSALTARHVLDAYAARRADETAAAIAGGRARAIARLALGVVDDEDITAIVNASKTDPGWQVQLAWQLASRKESTAIDAALSIALAHEVVGAEGGLDYAHLDTYALALSKANLPEHAAMVCWRVLALCRTVQSECMIEKRRAYAYIYYAKETGLRWKPTQ